MILKSIDSKIGKVYCLRVKRVVKKSDGRLKKEPFTFVLTDHELKQLQQNINENMGIMDEHLMAVPVIKPNRRKAINSVLAPEKERRNKKTDDLGIFSTDLEIEV